MLDNFAIFILTHGRSDRVFTIKTLKNAGYTGRIIILIDNEDNQADDYQKRYGDNVYIFDKKAVAERIDEGDNFQDRRAIIYARNACFSVAEELGIEYFMELDDDYIDFNWYRAEPDGSYSPHRITKNFDQLLLIFLKFFKNIPALSIAFAQTGDFIGGMYSTSHKKPKRKCMNSFICSVNRPFEFFGRINEDVNTYTNLGARGGLFITLMQIALNQLQTQNNSGGMTELYLDSGTYIKSFYSVMYQPSSVTISLFIHNLQRLHHRINWPNTVPKIIAEEFKK